MERMPSLRGRALPSAVAALLTLALLLGSAPARADVTVQQKTTMALAGINIDMIDTERTSADRQRTDSTVHCHGFLALVCRNVQSIEIRRLDRQLEWDLQPKKLLCTERDFPTPEQRAKAQLAFEQNMAQLKSCPLPQQSGQSASAPDTSHCQMSPAKVDVQQSGEHQMLLGHDAHRSTITLSQTCTDPQTGHVCQFDYGFDLWLTPDDLPGLTERRDFEVKYATAQGLDPNNPQLRGMAQQFMAPYADTLKQMQSQAAALQGNPLRTTFFMDYGGPQCGNAQQQPQPPQQAQQQAPRRRGGLFGRIASNAVGSGVSGLFHHNVNIPTGSVGGQVASDAANQSADAVASSAADATANGIADATAAHAQNTGATSVAAPATPPGMVRMVSFTTELTAIDTTSIDASQFDLPAGYHVQPPPPPAEDKQAVCPANDH